MNCCCLHRLLKFMLLYNNLNMNKIIIICIACLLAITILLQKWFSILICILIIGLFLYTRLTPYKARLSGKVLTLYELFYKIFYPIESFIKSKFTPLRIGNGISIDLSQLLILIVLLAVLVAA